jgi:hypothetical protein
MQSNTLSVQAVRIECKKVIFLEYIFFTKNIVEYAFVRKIANPLANAEMDGRGIGKGWMRCNLSIKSDTAVAILPFK